MENTTANANTASVATVATRPRVCTDTQSAAVETASLALLQQKKQCAQMRAQRAAVLELGRNCPTVCATTPPPPSAASIASVAYDSVSTTTQNSAVPVAACCDVGGVQAVAGGWWWGKWRRQRLWLSSMRHLFGSVTLPIGTAVRPQTAARHAIAEGFTLRDANSNNHGLCGNCVGGLGGGGRRPT